MNENVCYVCLNNCNDVTTICACNFYAHKQCEIELLTKANTELNNQSNEMRNDIMTKHALVAKFIERLCLHIEEKMQKLRT